MNARLGLFILVEGDDDERFVAAIIVPRLRARYLFVKIVRYAEEPPEKIESYVRSMIAMGAEYLCLTDLNGMPCVTSKRDAICARYRSIQAGRIVVVKREIEAWYLAGIGEDGVRRARIVIPASTDDTTKEQFDGVIPSRFDSRNDFMIEILKVFSFERAMNRNSSLQYLVTKHDIPIEQ
jgi:hypothetical protein